MRCATLMPLGLSRRSHCSSPSSVLPSILLPSCPAPGLASGTVPGLAAGMVPCSTPSPITLGGPSV